MTRCFHINPTGMSTPLQIDLRGLEDKFSESGRQVCADCGRDFDDDTQRNEDDDCADDDSPIPLLLWKDDGKLMLTLCWPCATRRMGEKGFAE